jgi:hypothetical protein
MLFLDGSKYTIECHPVGYGRDLLILSIERRPPARARTFCETLETQVRGF